MIKGRCWVADDYVMAYDIIVQKYWTSALDPDENSKWVMAGVDEAFNKENGFKDEGYTFIVAGHNFAGGGKSIEHVITGLMGAGIKAVIADSFSRLQFRNAINYGFPFVTCNEIKSICKTGDELEVNLESGEIINHSSGKSIEASPIPDFVLSVAEEGGMVNYIQKVIKEDRIDELR
ncbi:MAG: 3-isopropylmalate dehydratase [Candidatus Marinimicrobia bacterium]|nr:3-isopropylmalate dehydratase [Candidatus Neomarinimicrobiota bacterium]|tara:strand:- start:3463 stop:3993 length:531 start_codon:yes stop_codon:yes gene_type:complete